MSDRNSTCSSLRSDSIFSGFTSAKGTRAYAGEAAGEVGVAEDPGDRVAEHLLGDPRVGVGVLAARVELRGAGAAGAARDRERDDDPVPDPQLRRVDVGPDLDDLAHEIVAHDVAVLHRRDVPVQQVQVRPADGGRGDPDDRVAPVEDPRVGDVADLDLVAPCPAVGLHDGATSLRSSGLSGCAGRCGNSARAFLPYGAPSERTTSPVSKTCLSRRRSSSNCWFGSSPKYFATALPRAPPGMS